MIKSKISFWLPQIDSVFDTTVVCDDPVTLMNSKFILNLSFTYVYSMKITLKMN